MIRDLETEMHRILDPSAREYMMESLNCYNIRAYRASVVLAVAAGMDDLREKFLRYANTGGVGQQISDEADDIKRRVNGQDVYERQVIKYASNAQLISPADAKALDVLMDIRNSCAHPGGHKSTPEEARYAITTMIDLILSSKEPAAITAIQDILGRITNVGFFPDQAQPKIEETIRHELVPVHTVKRDILVKKLFRRLRDLAFSYMGRRTVSSMAKREIEHENIRLFLGYLSNVDADLRKEIWTNIAKQSAETSLNEDIVYLCSVFPRGIEEVVEPLERERLQFLIRKNLNDPECGVEAKEAAKQWRLLELIAESELTKFTDALREPFDLEQDAQVEQVLKLALDLNWDPLLTYVTDFFIDRSSWSIFDVANRAIKQVQSWQPPVVNRIVETQRWHYILHVADSARSQTSYGSNEAKHLVFDRGLGPRVDFIDSFMKAVDRSPDDVFDFATNWSNVEQLLTKSQRSDSLKSLPILFKGRKIRDHDIQEMFIRLAESSDKELAAIAEGIVMEIDAENQRDDIDESY